MAARRISVLIPLVAFAASALAAAALAWSFGRPVHRESAAAVGARPAPTADSESPNWTRPFTDGVREAGPASAGRDVGIRVVAPVSLGPPRSVFVHGDAVPRAQQGIALVYQTALHGELELLELRSEWTEQDLERPADDCASGAAVCNGTFRLVTLADGTRALQITGDPSTVVIFVRNGVKYQLQGPSETLMPADARSIAASVAAAAG